MTIEYHEDTVATSVIFRAPHWYYSVVYKWSERSQTYWVSTIQLYGNGPVIEQRSRETKTASWHQVSDLLDYLKDLELHYNTVYSE